MMCVAWCACCSVLHIPPGFPELLNGRVGFQESNTKPGSGSAELVPGRCSGLGRAVLSQHKPLQSLLSAQGAATPPNARPL